MNLVRYLRSRDHRPPGTLLHDVRAYFVSHLSDRRGAVLSRLMDRLASEELRHAALLLGRDFKLGYGTASGLLAYVPDFQIAEEIYEDCTTAADWKLADGLFELERARWVPSPSRRGAW
jgi:hypothetical protein